MKRKPRQHFVMVVSAKGEVTYLRARDIASVRTDGSMMYVALHSQGTALIVGYSTPLEAAQKAAQVVSAAEQILGRRP